MQFRTNDAIAYGYDFWWRDDRFVGSSIQHDGGFKIEARCDDEFRPLVVERELVSNQIEDISRVLTRLFYWNAFI